MGGGSGGESGNGDEDDDNGGDDGGGGGNDDDDGGSGGCCGNCGEELKLSPVRCDIEGNVETSKSATIIRTSSNIPGYCRIGIY